MHLRWFRTIRYPLAHEVTLRFDGQFMRGHPLQPGIEAEIYAWGFHEFAATQCMKRAIRPRMVVVDAGGERGYNTLLGAKRVGPRGRVLVFERREDVLGLLQANVAANGYANVTVRRLALSGAEGTVSETPSGGWVLSKSTSKGPSCKSCGVWNRLWHGTSPSCSSRSILTE